MPVLTNEPKLSGDPALTVKPPVSDRAWFAAAEIVRRRWPRIPHEGFLLVFITSRAILTAPHQQLATEVESLLAHAGALAPAVDA